MSMHAFRSIVTASRNAVNTIEITSQGLWGYVPGRSRGSPSIPSFSQAP